MRKSKSLSKKLTAIIGLAIIGNIAILKSIFVWKEEMLKGITYKSDNLIIQTLDKGEESKETLVVLGNGWNVSVNKDDRVTKHDPFFLIPKEEAKLLDGNGYEIITAYFPFECDGINQSGQELAQFINTHYQGYQVILIGHSKSGVCFANLSKWLEADGEDATVITVSAPYGGVKSDKDNLQNLNKVEKAIYPKIIVPHQTNDDITINSNFLEDVSDFSGLETRNFYCVKSILSEKTSDPVSILLKWTDNKFGIDGDGIVGFKEQKPPVKPKEDFVVWASHQASMQEAIKLLKSKGIL